MRPKSMCSEERFSHIYRKGHAEIPIHDLTPTTGSESSSDQTSRLSARRNWWVRSRAWMGLLIIAPFAGLALVSRPTVAQNSWADLAGDAAAWTLFALGAAMRWWATLYIGGKKSARIACLGPYSICRNPLYLGTFLLCAAIAVYLKSLTFGLGLLLASAYYLAVTVPSEERRLTRKFGAAYVEYVHNVPRYFPRWGQLVTPAVIEVRVSGLVAESWRAARWMWIPVICALVEHFRFEPWWPRLLNLP